MISTIKKLFPQSEAVSDQTYYEATIDDGLYERDLLTNRIVEIARKGGEDDKKIKEAIDVINSAAKKEDGFSVEKIVSAQLLLI